MHKPVTLSRPVAANQAQPPEELLEEDPVVRAPSLPRELIDDTSDLRMASVPETPVQPMADVQVHETTVSAVPSRSAPIEIPSILSAQPYVNNQPQQKKLPVPHISTPTVSGWQLGRLAIQKIAQSESMLKRRAPMSARQHATEALHLLAQSTDELTHTENGTVALSQALTATREAADFLGRFGATDDSAVQRLVDAHSTRVLKRCDVQGVTPLRAADVYYEFARQKFTESIGNWPTASQALVILSKTEAISREDSDANLSAAQVCYLRSAIACDPNNAVAANDLGHELLALGMFRESRWALEHSYAQRPSRQALHDLAELHRVTGNIQLAQACATTLASLKDQPTRVAQVMNLTPAQFAAVSPPVVNGNGSLPFTGVLHPTNEPRTAARPAAMYPNSQPPTNNVRQANMSPTQTNDPAGMYPAQRGASSQRGRVARALDQASDSFKGLFR